MKTTMHILTLIPILFFSCGQSNERNKIAVVATDTFQTKLAQKEKERLDKRKEYEAQEKIDSLNLGNILKRAIQIAEQTNNLEKLKENYVETMPDSSYQVQVSISGGHYFTKTNSHLTIRRKGGGIIFIDIFSKIDKHFHKVISHQESEMTYVGDTIRDINGDGLKDFVVNWYGSSGCCLKAFSNVYLMRADEKMFSKSFEFINPTFSPKEKIVRGICYGHPGETEMYKYKWNGEAIDTLEYISYEKNEKGVKTGKVIVSNRRPFKDNSKILKRLNSVPNEYKSIDGFDWFIGKGYE